MAAVLVGLVSLFVAVLPSGWGNRASAQTTPVATTCTTPASLVMNPGASISLSIDVFDADGEVMTTDSTLTFAWSANFGTVTPTNASIVSYTAPSSGTATVTVTVNQSGQSPTLRCTNTTSVTVQVAAATTATPAPTNPTGTPPAIPTASTPNTTRALVTPAEGGTVTASGNSKVKVTVPAGAVSGDWFGVQVQTLSTTTGIPAVPAGAGFKLGSIVIDIKFTDKNGTPLANFRTNRPVQICVPYTQADVDAALGGPAGLTIYHYSDAAQAWEPLNTTVDLVNGVACAFSSSFSFYGLGYPVAATTATPAPGTPTAVPTAQATSTATVKLPSTGDRTAGGGLLGLAALTGIAFAALGAFALWRARKSSV